MITCNIENNLLLEPMKKLLSSCSAESEFSDNHELIYLINYLSTN